MLSLFVSAHVFNCCPETRSVLSMSLANNPFPVIGVIAVRFVQVSVMKIPAISGVLNIEALDVAAWLSLVIPALSIVLVMEIHKLVNRHGSTEIRRIGSAPMAFGL